MDEAGTISRFGALIDAEAIGGTATLVAMHAPEERFDEVVEQVNNHPRWPTTTSANTLTSTSGSS